MYKPVFVGLLKLTVFLKTFVFCKGFTCLVFVKSQIERDQQWKSWMQHANVAFGTKKTKKKLGVIFLSCKYFPLCLMVQFLSWFFFTRPLQCFLGLCVCKQKHKPSLSGLCFLVAEVPRAEVQVRGGGAARGILHPLRLVLGLQLRRGPVLEPAWNPALHDGLRLKEMPQPSQLNSCLLPENEIPHGVWIRDPFQRAPSHPKAYGEWRSSLVYSPTLIFRKQIATNTLDRLWCEELRACRQPCIYNLII